MIREEGRRDTAVRPQRVNGHCTCTWTRWQDGVDSFITEVDPACRTHVEDLRVTDAIDRMRDDRQEIADLDGDG